jgi:hypothetical protein
VLQKVAVGQWSLDAYEGIVPAPILSELREHAHALKGARILNDNPTSYGGGVSELLRSSVLPLTRGSAYRPQLRRSGSPMACSPAQWPPRSSQRP